MRRHGRRWSTAFGNWVQGYGVSRLTSDLNLRGLGVTQHAVYQWVSGGTAPHPSRALAITQLSARAHMEAIKEGREALPAISLEDVYRHRAEVGS